MQTLSRNVIMLVVLAIVLPSMLLAQGSSTGGITGVVKDPSGALIPNAKVVIIDETTGVAQRELLTDDSGAYTATLLPVGSYRIEATVMGFKKYTAIKIPVRIGETTRHDVTLEVGQVDQTVTVEATPTLINTESAVTGQSIEAKTLEALPLPVPNFLFLLTLSAGAAGEPPDVRSANRGIVDINVAGQRTSNNSYSIEGVNANDFNLAHFDTVPLPNTNTIQEFKVATSLYDASSGSKGGGAVNLVLKSGTKDFHGQAYIDHRNDALNANEWFRNRDVQPLSGQTKAKRARLLQNVFGASGSGPVLKLGGFWYANYQGVRARNGLDPSGASLSPTIQSFPMAGDGTTSAALLAQAFRVTPQQIDPIAVNILNLKSGIYGGSFLVPRPGQAGCGSPSSPNGPFSCTFSRIANLRDDQFTITYDRFMRDNKDKLTFRWFYDNGLTLKPYGTAGTLAFPQDVLQNNRFFTVAHTHLISERQLNEFRFGFSRFNSSFIPTDLVKLGDIGATRPNASSLPGAYFFNITGLFSVGTGVNDERGTVSNQFHWSDTWSLTKGNHTIRAGGETIRYQLNRFNRFASRGSLTFQATTGEGNTFNAFENFLQGRVTALQSGTGDAQRYFRATDVAGFFQDDWRIHPRVTLNLGMRWEGLSAAHDKFFRSAIYIPDLLNASPPRNPFLFAENLNLGGFRGLPGVSDCALNSCFDKHNFAPRFGFAWDVFGDHKTVVRGGYGIYYQRLSNQNLLQGSLAPPFFVQLIDNRPVPQAFQLRDPLAGQPPPSAIATAFIPQIARFAGITGGASPNDPNARPLFINEAGRYCRGFAPAGVTDVVDNCAITLASYATATPDMHAPYTQQWNFTVQRELGRGWAVELGYVGSHYVGGLGIWAPDEPRVVSPSNPITVTDINGVAYTVTTNTANNEPLRHGVLGLSRARGARIDGNIGQAMYHSGQLTVSRKFQSGLFFQGAYTWSKTIDNVSGSQSTDELNAFRNSQGGANILNSQRDLKQNRARGDFDRPHRLVVSYAWDIPLPKGGLLGSQLFQGWNIAGIVTFQSGLPYNIFDSTSGGAFGNNNNGTGVLICRPQSEQISTRPGCVPGTASSIGQLLTTGRIQDRLNNFLNPNFVSTAQPVPNSAGSGVNGYGNVPRNAFRAPFQQNWDFTIGKRFKFAERHVLNFRTDFFNVWNHPIFQIPATVQVPQPGTFGRITSTVIPSRLIQFSLKYDF